MKKFIFLAFYCLIYSNFALGQPAGVNKMLPPSPEVSSFIKRGDFPVSYYTGTPNISIPLFTLEEKGFSLPIDLSYSGTAIRVSDLPTWVGLNWDLLPGGCITQIALGSQDLPGNNAYGSQTYLDYYNQIKLGKTFPEPSHLMYDDYRDVYGAFVPWNSWTDVGNIDLFNPISIYFDPSIMASGDIYQPDIYTFNFLGYSGSFYINPFTQVVKFLKKDGHIIFEDQRISGGWKATLPNGIKVFFFAKESSFVQQPGSIQSFSWKISKVELVNGEEITFSYTDKSYTNYQLSHYTTGSSITNSDDQRNTSVPVNYPPAPPSGTTATTQIPYENYNKYLNKIESSHYVIDFSLTNESKPKLSSLQVFNKSNNQMIKKISFNYSEFTHSGAEWNIPANQAAIYAKYKLTSLQESFLNNGVSSALPPYTFNYIEDIGLPHILSLSQDYWGFFNGEINTNFLPDESRMLTTNHFSGLQSNFLTTMKNFCGSYRYVGPLHLKQGMLNQITYPTKGKTVFNYEPHVFKYNGGHFRTKDEYFSSIGDPNAPSQGAGLRIKEIINYDQSGVFASRQKFKYDSSTNTGLLLQPIHFWSIVPKVDALGENFVFYHSYNLTSQNLYSYPLISNLVGYTLVDVENSSTEVDSPQEQVNGKISYQFQNGEMYDHVYLPGEINYGYLSELNVKNGLTDAISYRNAAGQLVKKTEYTYSLVDSEDFDAITAERVFSCSSCVILEKNHSYKIEFYPMNTRIWKQGSIIENDYVNNVLTSKKESLVEFGSGPYFLPFKEQIKRSDDSKEIVLTTYPNDYPSGTPFIDNMKNNYLQGYPIEQVNYKEVGTTRTVLSGKITKYKQAGKALIDEVIELETSNPVALASFKFSNRAAGLLPPTGSATAFSMDSRYGNKLIYDSYDAKGNLLSLSKEKGPKTSYKWGYKEQYPIAEAKNSALNEIYSQNFEEPELGLDFEANVIYDNTRMHTGKYSGRIINPNSTEFVSHSSKRLNISLTAPKKFTFSGWVFSNGPSVQLFLFMMKAGETGYNTYYDHVQTTTTNKWVYMKKEFLVPADVVQMFLRLDNNAAGTVWFDDLRIQPSDASMSTYTYEPLVGMTSAIDDSGKTVYYEYDTFQRLMNIKDQNGFIIKNYDYHYKP